MPNIKLDFAVFLPSLGTFYNYFNILKSHNFINDVKVINKNDGNTLKVFRKESILNQRDVI
jgi:hypothetical protein